MKLVDLTGQRFGQLTVLHRGPNDGSGKARWYCRCDCGRETLVSRSNLKSGNIKTCGKHEKIADLSQQRFGRLTALALHHNNHGRPYWLCQCDCGKQIVVFAGSLKSGNTSSCGCLHRELLSSASKTHGDSGTRLYHVWKAMHGRCYNPNNKNYSLYGGRGIIVCDEWLKDFSVFKQWAIQNGYEAGLTIDRINGDLNYCPDNCRWVTQKEQTRNVSRNHVINFQGATKCASEWAEIYHMPPDRLYERLKRGWPIEDALTLPRGARRRKDNYGHAA